VGVGVVGAEPWDSRGSGRASNRGARAERCVCSGWWPLSWLQLDSRDSTSCFKMLFVFCSAWRSLVCGVGLEAADEAAEGGGKGRVGFRLCRV